MWCIQVSPLLRPFNPVRYWNCTLSVNPLKVSIGQWYRYLSRKLYQKKEGLFIASTYCCYSNAIYPLERKLKSTASLRYDFILWNFHLISCWCAVYLIHITKLCSQHVFCKCAFEVLHLYARFAVCDCYLHPSETERNSTFDFGNDRIGELRTFRRGCANAQTRQSLLCSCTQIMYVDEDSYQILDR